jgi:class 3 adenylate cyclase
MDRFFAILSEGVHCFEGTVNEYRGDGIMALFGARRSHTKTMLAAPAYAALYLQDGLRRASAAGVLCQIQGWVKLSASAGQCLSVASSRRLDGTAEES